MSLSLSSIPTTQRPRIIVYDLGLLNFQRNSLSYLYQKHYFTHYRLFNFSKYPSFWNISIAQGEYAWKPAIIAEVSREFPGIVVWLDSGTFVSTNFLKNVKKLEEWEKCARVKECIAPNGSNRSNHRQDQSILTYMIINNNRDCDSDKRLFEIQIHRDKYCIQMIWEYEKLYGEIWKPDIQDLKEMKETREKFPEIVVYDVWTESGKATLEKINEDFHKNVSNPNLQSPSDSSPKSNFQPDSSSSDVALFSKSFPTKQDNSETELEEYTTEKHSAQELSANDDSAALSGLNPSCPSHSDEELPLQSDSIHMKDLQIRQADMEIDDCNIESHMTQNPQDVDLSLKGNQNPSSESLISPRNQLDLSSKAFSVDESIPINAPTSNFMKPCSQINSKDLRNNTSIDDLHKENEGDDLGIIIEVAHKWKNDVSRKDSLIKELNDEIHGLKNTIEQRDHSLSLYIERMSIVEALIKRQQTYTDHNRERIEKMKAKYYLYRNSLSNMLKRMEEVRDEKSRIEKRSQIAQMTDLNTHLTESNSQLNNVIAQLRQLIQDSDAKSSCYASELESTREKLDVLLRERDTERMAHVNKCQNLESLLKYSEDSNKALMTSQKENEERLTALKKDIQKVQQELESTRAEHCKLENEWRNERTQLESECLEERAQRLRLESDYRDERSERFRVENDLRNSDRKLEEMLQEIDNSKLKYIVAIGTTDIPDLDLNLQYNKAMFKFDQEQSSSETKIEELSRTVETWKSKAESLESQLSIISTKHDELQNEHSKVVEEMISVNPLNRAACYYQEMAKRTAVEHENDIRKRDCKIREAEAKETALAEEIVHNAIKAESNDEIKSGLSNDWLSPNAQARSKKRKLGRPSDTDGSQHAIRSSVPSTPSPSSISVLKDKKSTQLGTRNRKFKPKQDRYSVGS
ncbi:6897_t:CDS:10 [Racocetra fulgida]|uniref:6897_t:CDS:1 n=1 Tax=Racocetra fulgida TaxID=60492 RepID=A0A9N9FHA7_9GLOM|nr:6897_t:CDS:10 [Racocetra fulgida]